MMPFVPLRNINLLRRFTFVLFKNNAFYTFITILFVSFLIANFLVLPIVSLLVSNPGAFLIFGLTFLAFLFLLKIVLNLHEKRQRMLMIDSFFKGQIKKNIWHFIKKGIVFLRHSAKILGFIVLTILLIYLNQKIIF